MGTFVFLVTEFQETLLLVYILICIVCITHTRHNENMPILISKHTEDEACETMN